MGRGKSTCVTQSEKLLLILLDGHETSVDEITTCLGGEIVLNRIAAYIWDLKQIGAYIKRNRVGKLIVSYQLDNTEEMHSYALKRGLIAPPIAPLSLSDFAVSS